MANQLLKFPEIAMFYSAYKQINKGWVRNRIDSKNIDTIQGEKFAALVPNFHDNHIGIHGSITWGKSGFTFFIKVELEKSTSPILTIHRHFQCNITEELIPQIVEELLDLGNKKFTSNQDTFPMFQEPTLKAHVRSTKISQRSRENIEYFKNQGVFDNSFASFLLKNELNGIRCTRSRKSS
ncbi:hypothetical protein LEAN103870_12365 [Legionella anisa]|uniref:Uncharacterized protein n=1 Tax=Legionella anisa TaxID=28082 RepID=A0AAX0WPF1_9GAMM|nr:hypothetical protein [Legionella anisa]AWN73271.1 hypothetical protein DLD14_05115 [Legionella anisa]KTC67048.1 hypothetical protein Lani_3393 [Legionella anisa]MBN5936040.1 hypothetical protein [Legionella anisa]MCW8424115.1 hypothetical protein [Legionella anisa]MCW8447638.1 hypothetical protein [Legionella anisa]